MGQATENEANRQKWLKRTLESLPEGAKILDAGAGELKNKKYCKNLNYVSQDFCEFDGTPSTASAEGIQSNSWDTTQIDIVCDIEEIPEGDETFDAILCSEVLEHIPEPTKALDEFVRLLKPGGILIITAPFSSNVHMAPYHFCTGFSKYWYQHHLPKRGLTVKELEANGDWYSLLKQEISRLGPLERQRKNWAWPLGYVVKIIVLTYLKIRSQKDASDLACFGWHCIACKNS